MVHRNARTTFQGRLLIVQRRRAGWKQAHIAKSMGIPRKCMKKWLDRNLDEGAIGLRDRSSPPYTCPQRASAEVEKEILGLRHRERRGPDWIGAELGVPARTVFGSKEGLLDAVMVRVMNDLADAVPTDGASVGEYVGRVYDFHRDNRWLLRLFLWESLHDRVSDLLGDDERRHAYATKIAWLAEQTGRPANVTTAFDLILLIGMAAWPKPCTQCNG